jgi:hypothetical protein
MRRAARSDAVGRAGPPTTARVEMTGGRRAETDSGSPGVWATLERDRLAPQPGGRSHGPLTHIAQLPHNASQWLTLRRWREAQTLQRLLSTGRIMREAAT